MPETFLSHRFTPDMLLSPAEWQPYPRWIDRAAWQSISEPVRQSHLAHGRRALDKTWPHLPATLYLQYARNGNRRNYERPYFKRRDLLARMLVAECIEGEGAFFDTIGDAAWSICEESTWCVPAHVGVQQAGVGLPDITEPIVDLFAAETAALLAWTLYLVGPQLERVSPLLAPRLRREVTERMLTPCLNRNDFWWMGFTPRKVNNWNPWVNSNWLACALLVEEDPARRAAAVEKITASLDRFLVPYPRDGGCDEGPSYWGRAGASLFDCLVLLHSATAGQLDVFSEPLVQEIGRFIYRAHIAGQYYINFADAPARLVPDSLLVFRYGHSIGDETMQRFGAWLAGEKEISTYGFVREGEVAPSLGRLLPGLFALDALAGITPEPALLRDVWLEEIQVMAARDREGSAEGFYLAAKGGHNDESHNHNDVGHFVVYRDGLPLIVDAGVETYTKKTFSSQRYEIWTMQSDYHSLPGIGGVMQAPGAEFAARDVHYSAGDDAAWLDLDIAGAYPPEAGLKRWRRTIRLERGRQVKVVENYALARLAPEITFHLVTAARVDLSEPGRVALLPGELADGRVSAGGSVRYDGSRLTASSQEIPISDERLGPVWGERLAHITFRLENPAMEGQLEFTIE